MCCHLALHRFSSSDTLPSARGSWAPPIIQLVDGHFSPDGTSFCVSDVAGQFSVYALGPPTPLLLSAPYDQFFIKDYEPTVQDHQTVWDSADQEVGAAPGVPVLPGQQLLCDHQFQPYDDGFQEAYKSGRVYDFVKAGGGGMCLRGSSMTLPPSLIVWPPTITAAAWKALEDRAALAARRSSNVPSEEHVRDVAERHALLEHSRLLAALSIGMTLREEEQHTAQLAASRQQQQQQTQEQQQTHEQNAPSAMPVDDQQLVLWDDAAGDADDHEFGELGDSDYSAQESLTDETDWDDGDNSSESDASEGQRQRRSERQRQRQRRQAAAAVAGDRPLRSRLRGRHTAEDGVRHRSDMQSGSEQDTPARLTR
eukprot:GHRR01019496.1.p1 GENE.GHRR01019496.1~~GHRR01019496.1.p1  ORF type:complete len:368 (+),score=107.75 GHRR01019496.1:129-1232(+)